MNYPYSRQQIAPLFRSRPIRGQPVYNFDQSKQFLKKQMKGMEKYGYDFAYKQWDFRNSEFERKKMRRRVYTRIKCSRSCLMKDKHSNKNDNKGESKQFQPKSKSDHQSSPVIIPKKWTTYYGCAQIRFAVVDLDQFFEDYPQFISKQISASEEIKSKKNKKIVLWNLYIFRQKCIQCMKYGYTQIYRCQMQAIAKAFCRIIAEIIAGIEAQEYVQDNQTLVKEPPEHQTELCEACKYKVCFWLIWKKKYDLQQQRLRQIGNNEESDSSDIDNEQNGSHHEIDEDGDDDLSPRNDNQ